MIQNNDRKTPLFNSLLRDTLKYENYTAFLDDAFKLLNETDDYIEFFLKLDKRLVYTDNYEEYPFFVFQNHFELDFFQMYCILLGALPYRKSKGKQKVDYDNAFKFSYARKSNSNLFVMTDDFKNFFVEYKNNSTWDFLLIIKRNVYFYIMGLYTPFEFDFIKLNEFFNHKFSADKFYDDIDLEFSDNTKVAIQVVADKLSDQQFHIINCIIKKSILIIDCYKCFELDYKINSNIFYEIYHQCFYKNAVPCLCEIEKVINLDSYDKNFFLSELFNFLQVHFDNSFIITKKNTNLKPFVPSLTKLLIYKTEFPSYKKQVEFWAYETETQNVKLSKDVDFNAIANKFNFSLLEISNIIKKASQNASIKNEEEITTYNLENCCKSTSTNILDLGSELINAHYTWDDLVITNTQKTLIIHACNYIKKGNVIYEDWNFKKLHSYGKNLSILLEGPPGTGKTMSAQVIANDLNMTLYKIDISKVTSRYIGESEKRLELLFDEAEKTNSIIFIDEMESFFSKRTEIRDSHDKYANMQTSFLLQKVEDFKGILILATNHLEYIDDAFIRRIKFIISMSLPEEAERLKIWKKMFPKAAPTEEIDFEFLAKNFKISGGIIKNVVIKAAFLSRSESKNNITMESILKSLKYEMSKQGNILTASDFKEYSYLY